MTRIFHRFFYMKDGSHLRLWHGCDIRLVFTPRDSTLQYKRWVHLWNNFPCIITLGYNVETYGFQNIGWKVMPALYLFVHYLCMISEVAFGNSHFCLQFTVTYRDSCRNNSFIVNKAWYSSAVQEGQAERNYFLQETLSRAAPLPPPPPPQFYLILFSYYLGRHIWSYFLII